MNVKKNASLLVMLATIASMVAACTPGEVDLHL